MSKRDRELDEMCHVYKLLEARGIFQAFFGVKSLIGVFNNGGCTERCENLIGFGPMGLCASGHRSYRRWV